MHVRFASSLQYAQASHERRGHSIQVKTTWSCIYDTSEFLVEPGSESKKGKTGTAAGPTTTNSCDVQEHNSYSGVQLGVLQKQFAKHSWITLLHVVDL